MNAPSKNPSLSYMTSIFHPHILTHLVRYFTYNEMITLSKVSQNLAKDLFPYTRKLRLAKKYLIIWYKKTRESRIGDILYTGNQTYVYMNLPNSEFRSGWKEWDGSEYPLKWEHISSSKFKFYRN